MEKISKILTVLKTQYHGSYSSAEKHLENTLGDLIRQSSSVIDVVDPYIVQKGLESDPFALGLAESKANSEYDRADHTMNSATASNQNGGQGSIQGHSRNDEPMNGSTLTSPQQTIASALNKNKVQENSQGEI